MLNRLLVNYLQSSVLANKHPCCCYYHATFIEPVPLRKQTYRAIIKIYFKLYWLSFFNTHKYVSALKKRNVPTPTPISSLLQHLFFYYSVLERFAVEGDNIKIVNNRGCYRSGLWIFIRLYQVAIKGLSKKIGFFIWLN